MASVASSSTFGLQPPAKKRARGSYAKFICLRCRNRKIKCVLPDDESIQPSSQPQPPGKACQRCEQNGFECIVDHTTLGRPKEKRRRPGSLSSVQEAMAEDDGDTSDSSHSAPPENYIVSMRHTDGPEDTALNRPTNDELAESLIGSISLMNALLMQDKAFARSLPSSTPKPGVDCLSLVDDKLAQIFDEHLVWHRFYFPYVPTVTAVRRELLGYRREPSHSCATRFLMALLCLAALDVPSRRIHQYTHLVPMLRAAAFNAGQQTMYCLPVHRHTVTALQFASVYQPTAVACTREAVIGAVRGRLFITCAKRVADELGFARAHLDIPLLMEPGDEQQLENRVLDCLHWSRLSLIDSDIFAAPKQFEHLFRKVEPSIEASLAAVELALHQRPMSASIIYTYVHLRALADLWDAGNQLARCWRRLDKMIDILQDHQRMIDQQKVSMKTWAGQLHTSCQQEQAYALVQLSNSILHERRSSVIGVAMWFAIMSANSPTEDIAAEDAVKVGDYVIESLQAHDETDPNRPPLRIFLETYGGDWMEQLQRKVTNFISNCDLRLDGMKHVAPYRIIASDLLFACKDIVENNSAMYKGWGGLHDNIDTLLILFQSCAQNLQAMSATGQNKDAIAEGNVLAASARLIRSLHDIMAGWKRNIAEAEQARASSYSGEQGNDALFPVDNMLGSLDNFEWPGEDDFFREWNNWPHLDALDFSQLSGSNVAF